MGKRNLGVELAEPFRERVEGKTFLTNEMNMDQSNHFWYGAFTNSSLEIFLGFQFWKHLICTRSLIEKMSLGTEIIFLYDRLVRFFVKSVTIIYQSSKQTNLS